MSSPTTTELERLQQLAEGRLGDDDLEQLTEVLRNPRRFDELVTQLSREPGEILESLRNMPKEAGRKAKKVAARILQGVSEIASAVNSIDNTQSIPPEIQQPLSQAAKTQAARREVETGKNDIVQFESFRIRGILGRGGMGTVYQADDERLGRQVAIKTLNRELASQPGAIDRFLREARTAARVEHDHICPIYQVGEENGIPFIAMPLLKGEPLNERIRREQRISIDETLRIGREIALGLAAAHDARLIHRDIKPANIWLENQRGRPCRVRILDFGLARGNAEESELSTPGLVMGTPAYMAPEQARGHKLDARADLWSLGVILYEMATGIRPFNGTDSMGVLTSIAVDDPLPPEKHNPAISPQFSRLIMRLLAKKRENRPADAQEVVETIQQIQIESTFPMVEEMPARPMLLVAQPVPENEFAHLEDDPTYVETPKEPAKTTSTKTVSLKKQAHSKITAKILKKKSPKPWLWPTVGIAGLLLVVVVGIVLIVNKVRPPQKIEAAEAPKEELKKESKPQPPKTTNQVSKPVEPDRKAAEFVLSAAGTVQLAGSIQVIENLAQLPKGPIQLEKVVLYDNPRVTDAAMSVFKECKNLTAITLFNEQLSDAALSHFKDCKNLKSLRLSGRNFSEAGLANFKDCDRLVELQLGMPQLTDAGMAMFAHCKNIISLAFINCPNLTKRGFENFENHRDMRLLCLINIPNLTNDDLAVFKEYRNLDLLQLDSCKGITDAGFEVFKNFVKLQSLQIARLAITDKAIAAFAGNNSLRYIGFMDLPKVTDVGGMTIAKLPSLASFDAMGTQITRAMLEKAVNKRPTVVFRLNDEIIVAPIDSSVADYVLAHRGSVRVNNSNDEIKQKAMLPDDLFSLTGIRFEPNNPVANDEFLSKAAQCKNLRHLSMWKSQATDAGLAHFKGAKSLLEIHFENTPITDAGIANFSECKNLWVLGLNGTKITDEGLKTFKGFTNFGVIGLDDTNVGTEGLSQFGECKFLDCLGLMGTRVTDADLDLFAKSTELRRLYLGRTQITDACVPRLLQFKNLTELDLHQTKISLEKIEELRKALPNCKIILEGKKS